MATANQQVQLASSIPDAGWGDSTLTNWLAQNQGKAYYDANGQQQIIPSGASANAGTIRSWINGTMRGMSITPPADAGAAAGAGTGASPSYLSNVSSPDTQSNSMATNDPSQASPQQMKQYFVSMGGSPNQDAASIAQYYQAKHPPAAAQQDAFGITRTDSGQGYTTLTNAKTGQTVNVDQAGNYFTTDAQGNNTPVADAQAVSMGFQSANPEAQAQKQLAQIDPQSEALRSQLAASYQDPNTAANPTAAQYQSYLNTFQQVDPTEYAERQNLASGMDSYLQQMQDQNALGSQLDPVTAHQVEQQTRAGQAARGNVYGTPQMVEEAMTTGQAGLALQQQRQAALSSALGQQQSYLGSGLGLGDTAMSLYQQGLSNKSNAQQNILSYLSSGQTPYQASSAYVNQAQGNAANAAQGGPVYNPASLGAGNLGTAQQAPQYGLDVGAQSQNYFNSLNNAYGGAGGAATKNKTAAALSGAASGALSGAATGATAGSVIPGVGTLIGGASGALIGGVAGGAGGYYS